MPEETASIPSEENVARLARIAIESGLASKTDVQGCLAALQQIHQMGVQSSLLEVMVDKGVLSANEAHAVQVAVESGDAAGLLGGYQLLEQLGEGGMGTVYLAKQLSLNRLVAVKILPEHFSKDAKFVARFKREAQSAAKINHPNIVGAIDVGEVAGKHYFAMEYVEGKTIAEILDEEGKISEARALKIIIQMSQALEAAWRNNLVHRDVKPDNILITPDGVAILVDLGLARETTGSQDASITMPGIMLGTPHYISPEQASGEEVDIRSDIYSLGATLYHMVTGQTPFFGTNSGEVIQARFKTMPPLANEANRELSPGITAVIEFMMAVDPDDRYPDPRVLSRDLLLLASGQTPEFANPSATMRMRAVEAAKSSSADINSHMQTVRPKRPRTVVGLAVFGVAVFAAVALTAALLLNRNRLAEQQVVERLDGTLARVISAEEVATAAEELRGIIDAGDYKKAIERAERLAVRLAGGPGVNRLDQLRDEAALKLRQKQAQFVDEAVNSVRSLINADSFEEAITSSAEFAAKFKDAPGVEKLNALQAEATQKRNEELRRQEKEKEEERRYSSFISEAKSELDSGDYSTSLGLLAQARGIKDTAKIDELASKARLLQFVSRGREAERKGNLDEAVNMYKKALKIEENKELSAKVSELERQQRLSRFQAEADKLLAMGEWAAARDKYTEAFEIAEAGEKELIKKGVAKCDSELAFLEALGKVEEAAEAEEWKKVIGLADDILSTRSDDARVAELRAQAKKALGPEKTITNSIGMKFVLIPAGEFTMGSDKGDEDEKPVHKVHLDAYYISTTEITNVHFEQFMPAHREKWKQYSPDDNMPAVAVTWDETMAFCRWLSQKEGIEYRLSTEAEWEKAARGTDRRTYPWGDEIPGTGEAYQCNFAPDKAREHWGKDGFEFAAPVGSFSKGASPFGCLDMAGNVWEWCLDWYQPDWYGNADRGTKNTSGPKTGDKRVLRGGSFTNSVKQLMCANRLGKPSDCYDVNIGFRCVRALDVSQ